MRFLLNLLINLEILNSPGLLRFLDGSLGPAFAELLLRSAWQSLGDLGDGDLGRRRKCPSQWEKNVSASGVSFRKSWYRAVDGRYDLSQFHFGVVLLAFDLHLQG